MTTVVRRQVSSSSVTNRALTRHVRVVAKRLAHAALLLLGVIMVNFTLIHLAPGDAATALSGEMGGGLDAAQMDAIREKYRLDEPMPTQLLTYVGGVLRGDLGQSTAYNQSVTSLIASRIFPTVLLVGTALTFAIVAGTLLGVFTARRPRNPFSHLATAVGLFGFSAPVFWTALMLLFFFAGTLQILPVGGMESIQLEEGWFARVLDVGKHLVLPAFSLAIVYLAHYSRLSRASMREVLTSDFVRTARAKGLPESSVVYKHALRNAVIPVVTMAGLHLGAVVSGTVIIETIYNWPGMGRLAYDAILRRDTSVLLGCLLTASLVVVVANLLTDASYRIIDPRIRRKSSE